MKYDLIGVLAHGDAVSLTPNDAQLAGGQQGGFWQSATAVPAYTLGPTADVNIALAERGLDDPQQQRIQLVHHHLEVDDLG
jgi:hypothetical protein